MSRKIRNHPSKNGDGDLQKRLNDAQVDAFRAFAGRVQMYVSNQMSIRERFERAMLDPCGRDLDRECGYPDNIDLSLYHRMFERNGIAARIVELFPDECWALDPDVYSTENLEETDPLEEATKQLNEDIDLWHHCHKADIQSRIGHYGILFLGLNDGLALDQPVRGFDFQGEPIKDAPQPEWKLNYIRAFPEREATMGDRETDPASPRYGHPVWYNVKFLAKNEIQGASSAQPGMFDKKIHWTRVLHIAETKSTSSQIVGMPALQRPWNDCLDVRKILGADGEGFWKAGFPGLAITTQPGIENPELDMEAVREQIFKYFAKTQRYLAASQVDINTLAPNIADPNAHFLVHIKAICISLGIPWRIFVGSEEAKLAADQDALSWVARVKTRQDKYLLPMLIRPLIKLLMKYGVLPRVSRPKYAWGDLNTPTPQDVADIGESRSRCIQLYMTSGAAAFIRPLHFLTYIMGLSLAQAQEIVKLAGGEAAIKKILAMRQSERATAGGKPGNKTPKR